MWGTRQRRDTATKSCWTAFEIQQQDVKTMIGYPGFGPLWQS
jgi:hypothetical protein